MAKCCIRIIPKKKYMVTGDFIKKRGSVPVLHGSHERAYKESLQRAEAELFSHIPLKLTNDKSEEFKIVLDDLTVLSFSCKLNGCVTDITMEKFLCPLNQLPGSLTTVGFSSNYNVLITSSKQSTQVEVIQSKPQKGKGSVVPLFELKKQTDLTVFTKDVGRAVTNLSLNTTNELLLVGFDDSLQIFAVILDKGHANTASLTFRLCALSTEPTVNYSTSFPIFLYKFSNSPVPTLVTVETAPTAATHLTFWQIDSHTLSLINKTELNIQDSISCFENSVEGSSVVIGCKNGALYLVELSQLDYLHKCRMPFTSKEICSIRWHPTSSTLIVVCDETSVYFFDRSLTLLSVQTELAHSELGVNIVDNLSYNAHIKQVEWMWTIESKFNEDSRNLAHETVVAVFDRGPVVIIRIELGNFSKGKIGHIELMAQFLEQDQLSKAVSLLQSIQNINELYFCWCYIVNHLLRADITHEQTRVSLKALLSIEMRSLFSKHAKYVVKIDQYFVRYCHLLLHKGDFEGAFKIATVINSPYLYKDVATWSKYQKQFVVAEIAKSKAELSSSSENSFWTSLDKQIIGISVIKEYMEALEASYQEGDVLSTQDSIRLGLWLESQGRLEEALELYYKYEMQYELKRLQNIKLHMTQ